MNIRTKGRFWIMNIYADEFYKVFVFISFISVCVCGLGYMFFFGKEISFFLVSLSLYGLCLHLEQLCCGFFIVWIKIDDSLLGILGVVDGRLSFPFLFPYFSCYTQFYIVLLILYFECLVKIVCIIITCYVWDSGILLLILCSWYFFLFLVMLLCYKYLEVKNPSVWRKKRPFLLPFHHSSRLWVT